MAKKRRKNSSKITLGGINDPMFKTQQQIEADLKTSMFEAAAIAGSSIGSSLLLQLAKNKISNPQAQKIFGKFGGIILTGLGAAGNAGANNYMTKAVASGMIGVGAIQTVFDNNLSVGSKMSVANTMNANNNSSELDGIYPQLEETYPEVDFENDTEVNQYIDQLLEDNQAINGIQEPELETQTAEASENYDFFN